MEHVRIDELQEFSPEEDIRKKLVSSEKIIAEICCYMPGQSTVKHLHPKQDEIFYIVDGKGIITFEDQDVHVSRSSVVFVPAGVKHGIQTVEDSNLLLMFIKSPGPSK